MQVPLPEQGSLSSIKQDLSSYLEQSFQIQSPLLEKARKAEHGHLSWPLFSIAKTQKTSPQKLAQEMSQSLQQSLPPFIKSCQPLSGFLNFVFQEDYIQKHLESLMQKKELMSFSLKPERHWLIDFASPNVAKFMNIGHLRATVLGQALVNLSRSVGIKVTALNHLGDWGGQFGKLLWAYKNWASEYDFEKHAFEALTLLYIRFYEEVGSDQKALKEARHLFQKLEEGDSELKKQWEFFVQLSLENYQPYWDLFNVKHDLVLGESFYVSFIEDLKSRLKARNLLTKSEGAEVVFLKGSKIPCLISKSDGSSTYASRDLCSLIYRFEKLKADRNLYITSTEQNLHFKQLFEVSEKLNPKWENQHLNFGIYRFKGEG